MEIIITWQVALFAIIVYFITRYLYDVFMKMATGCRNPFNPLYTYRDYPIWAKAYNRGVDALSKAVNKVVADSKIETDRLLQEMDVEMKKILQIIDQYEAEQAKKPKL